MREGLYELSIFHSRQKSVRQNFTVKGYTVLADLGRFEGRSYRLGFFHRFDRADFSLIADAAKSPLATAIAYLYKERGLAADKVFLLGHPRIFGYVFNPVSFFFYYNKGKHVATVAEVNNTFGEQKHFVVLASQNNFLAQKNFYVSPFLSPFSDFSMRITPPDEELKIGINTQGVSGIELVAKMAGVRRDLTRANLIRLFFKYPLHTLRAIALIHWFALKLFVRRVPFFSKAAVDAAVLHKNFRGEQ